MSEVVQAMPGYAFGDLDLNQVYAHHRVRNPASGRVLQKNGFRNEGVLRQRVVKWSRYEDVVIQTVLADDRRALS